MNLYYTTNYMQGKEIQECEDKKEDKRERNWIASWHSQGQIK